MDISDFCIGNYISFKDNWRIAKVTGVTQFEIQVRTKCGHELSFRLNKIRGIKLTDEIINLIGKKNEYLGNYWECENITFIQFEYGVFWIGLDNMTITSMEYVHELQNIWKLIHGKKLEINFKEIWK